MLLFMYTGDYQEKPEHHSEEVDKETDGEAMEVQVQRSDEGDGEAKESVSTYLFTTGATASLKEGLAQDDMVQDVQQLESPHTSIRVYAVADKYGVLPLMDVAKERFKLWISQSWASEELPAIAKEVFETTPETNDGLRELVADIVAEHIGVLILRDFWWTTLENSNPLSFMILKRTVSSTARLKRTVETLQEEMIDLRFRDRRLRNDLNEIETCRHCSREFGVCVDGQLGLYTFRCRHCRTRH